MIRPSKVLEAYPECISYDGTPCDLIQEYAVYEEIVILGRKEKIVVKDTEACSKTTAYCPHPSKLAERIHRYMICSGEIKETLEWDEVM